MHRIFLGLAITDGTLLLATGVFGFLVPPPPGGALAYWHTVHILLGLFTTILTLMVHSIAYTYFLGTGKWVKEVVRVYQLPDWVLMQAKKNKKRAFPFEFWSMMLIGGAAWMGAGVDALGWSSAWHLAAASIAIAFNLCSFYAEYLVIIAQSRLLLEVKRLADQLRLAQPAASDQSAGATDSRQIPEDAAVAANG